MRKQVIIVGGGMVGLTLALALGRQNISVLVTDKTPYDVQFLPSFDGRVSAIARGSKLLLDALGAWSQLSNYAEPIHDIRVSDSNTDSFLNYNDQEVGGEPFGYIAENRYIRKSLMDEVDGCESIDIMAPCVIKACHSSNYHTTVTCENGTSYEADLLIAADGKFSSLRKMRNIRTVNLSYPHSAIVCAIKHSEPHNGLAQERFLSVGPFAVLPMQGNHSSLVWTEPNERIDEYVALSEARFVEEITKRVGDYLGEIRLVGNRFTYPLSLSHAEQYVAERFALIGDAAHAIHPIAGQGVNLGFRDVAVLAELLVNQYRLGLDLGDSQMLGCYQQYRRFDNVSMSVVTDGLTRLFSNDIAPIKLARSIGLQAVELMPDAKQFFMRHAMGLEGDIPKLIKGEAL
jgi:2-octaprenyl-6-methoxyphenol hydroxylase